MKNETAEQTRRSVRFNERMHYLVEDARKKAEQQEHQVQIQTEEAAQ